MMMTSPTSHEGLSPILDEGARSPRWLGIASAAACAFFVVAIVGVRSARTSDGFSAAIGNTALTVRTAAGVLVVDVASREDGARSALFAWGAPRFSHGDPVVDSRSTSTPRRWGFYYSTVSLAPTNTAGAYRRTIIGLPFWLLATVASVGSVVAWTRSKADNTKRGKGKSKQGPKGSGT
jgi:hypothetical protein